MARTKIEELVLTINDIKTAVDRSAFGPMFMYPDELDFANKQVNQLAWNLFLHLITPAMKDFYSSPDCT